MAAQIWYENDGDLSVLEGKKVAIIGYGSQGHAHALNPRDSGVDVVVGLRPTSKSVEHAKEQGLEVKSVPEAAAEADIIMILAPDQYQRTIWANDIEPNIKPGAAVAFAHGFNIHYGYIKPSEDHPIFMVAPKGPGHIVRREYANGRGVPVVVAVEQDPRGDAWDITLAYAKALGALRAGAIKTTFTEETETDLFGEQNVLMGGVNKLVEMGFEVLTDAGYQPEIAYFEVCHELKMLVDLMNEGGLNKARWSCSDTAQYGDYTNTCIDEHVRERMQYHLQRIQDGSFAKEFIEDQDAGAPKFKALQEEYGNVRIETVGPKLRAMFSWNNGKDDDADMATFTGQDRPWLMWLIRLIAESFTRPLPLRVAVFFVCSVAYCSRIDMYGFLRFFYRKRCHGHCDWSRTWF